MLGSGAPVTSDKFAKLSLEKKLLTLNVELLAAAKQAGLRYLDKRSLLT